MAVKSKADLLKVFSEIVGDDTSDNVLNFMGDLTDTLDENDKNKSGQEDWKKKYEDNDAEWRKKYRERFMRGADEPDEMKPIKENDEPKLKTEYDELFK